MAAALLERLGAFLAGLRGDAVPEGVRQRARLQSASVFGAIFAAQQSGAVAKVQRWARALPDPHGPPLLGDGARVQRHAALLANAAASCAYDYDDYQLAAHTGHSAVLVPLLWGAGASWEDYELAQIGAAEVGGRLGLACLIGPQNGQHQPFVHNAAAAAAASRLLGLDASSTAHALALALGQPETALWPAFLGPADGKILTAATAALRGATAAELAAEGVSGAVDLLDHPKGFFRRFAWLPAPRAFDGLGTAWTLETLQVKEHPACAYFQTAIDAACAVAAEAREQLGRPLAADEIAAVRIHTTALGAAVDAHADAQHLADGGPLRANDVNFSARLSVALALADGELDVASLDEGRLAGRSAELRRLVGRMVVLHAWQLTRRLVSEVGGVIGAAALLSSASAGELALTLVEARRLFPHLPVRGGELRALAAEAWPLWRRLRGAGAEQAMARPLAGVDLPFATRLEVELTDGRRLTAERHVPRGAPSRPFAEARDLAAQKLVRHAGPRLGAARAERLAAALLEPAPQQRVADVLALAMPQRYAEPSTTEEVGR